MILAKYWKRLSACPIVCHRSWFLRQVEVLMVCSSWSWIGDLVCLCSSWTLNGDDHSLKIGFLVYEVALLVVLKYLWKKICWPLIRLLWI